MESKQTRMTIGICESRLYLNSKLFKSGHVMWIKIVTPAFAIGPKLNKNKQTKKLPIQRDVIANKLYQS